MLGIPDSFFVPALAHQVQRGFSVINETNVPAHLMQEAGSDRKLGKHSACFSDRPHRAGIISVSTGVEQRVSQQRISTHFAQLQSIFEAGFSGFEVGDTYVVLQKKGSFSWSTITFKAKSAKSSWMTAKIIVVKYEFR